MAKTKNQKLKRMRKRHPLLGLECEPFFYIEGHKPCRILLLGNYDFKTRKNCYLGLDPVTTTEPEVLMVHRLDGKQIFIESTSKKRITYRILADVKVL